MSLSIRVAGLTATAAITLAGALGAAAYADDAPVTDPCAQQQAKVDKATERLTACQTPETTEAPAPA